MHSALLQTIEDLFGLRPLLGAAALVPDLHALVATVPWLPWLPWRRPARAIRPRLVRPNTCPCLRRRLCATVMQRPSPHMAPPATGGRDTCSS